MNKQSTPTKELIKGPIGPDDPICPYFDRDVKACGNPNCPRLHSPCKWQKKDRD